MSDLPAGELEDKYVEFDDGNKNIDIPYVIDATISHIDKPNNIRLYGVFL